MAFLRRCTVVVASLLSHPLLLVRAGCAARQICVSVRDVYLMAIDKVRVSFAERFFCEHFTAKTKR